MSNARQREYRNAACIAQSGLCIHCHRPMAVPTAEHLRPRRDEGKDNRHNIAAAGRSCNHARHAELHYAGLSASEYGWLRLLEIQPDFA